MTKGYKLTKPSPEVIPPHQTRHLKTLPLSHARTCFTESMNKVDNCLHQYVPTLYNELSADKNDQIYIMLLVSIKIYCMHTGGMSIVI